MMTEQQISMVPKLRFPEFEGEWGKKPLSRISQLLGGYAFSSHRMTSKPQTYQVVKMSNLYGGRLDLNRSPSFIDEVFHTEEKYRIKPFDIALTLTGTLGKRDFGYSVIFDASMNNLFLNQRIGLLRFENEEVAIFVKFLIETKAFQDAFHSLAIGGTGNQANVSLVLVSKLEFSIPHQIEIKKIASFLTSVDTKITQLEKKKTLWESYKKGCMQKLFSQEIRFNADDGSEFPDWEEKQLSELGSFKSGTGFPGSEQGGKRGIPFYKVSDMNLKGNETTMTVANHYVTEEQTSRLGYKVIFDQAIVFAKVGAAIFLERKRKAENFLIDNNMMAFLYSGSIDGEFASVLFSTIRLSKFAQVGALPSYNSSDVGHIKVRLPNISEQTKIANFVTSIDQKINLIDQELQKARTFKKGLLQQMFV